jgi:allantoinase
MPKDDSTWPNTQHKNDGLSKYGGRDLIGYGNQTPTFKWPKGAKVALSFVINYEEGGEFVCVCACL